MRKYLFVVLISMLPGIFTAAHAQQSVWVQIEAKPNLAEAEKRAQEYGSTLQSVNGYSLGSGWYAIALGPFSPADATNVLRQLRITRQIPGDSYIVDGSRFRNQFWPVGAALGTPQPVAPSLPETETVAKPVIAALETPAQARRSEAQLSREERMMLQTALKWEGFYTGAIDGAIGPGTRNSMADWQSYENYDITGVLTTKQRNILMNRYAEVLNQIGMGPVYDTTAGIKIDMPLEMVELDRYEPPFAHFKSRNGSEVTALLISQSGDEATLSGLFDIMQTLDIVPLDGPREIGKNSFTLIGQSSKIYSYTYAALKNGHVKGFTLVWPAGDSKRRDLVISEMRASFEALPDDVLPDVYGDPNAAQSVDLLAGLTIRKADLSRTGFFVNSDGAILTTSEVIGSCEHITIDDEFSADVVASDAGSGLALLQPKEKLLPISFAQFQPSAPRINSEVAVSGYSYQGALGAPTLTYGKLSDLKGLKGEPTLKRLAMVTTEGDAGGPVFDTSGSVLGMLLPDENTAGKVLPEDVSFASDTVAIVDFLSANGIGAVASDKVDRVAPEDLTWQAADITVLVSCWN
ncbi:MAG: trypsin-like peptidase domain-containing protein [Marinosulfonomonas sp.]